jgi:hypothetical protein
MQQVSNLEVLEDVPALRIVDGEHVAPGHEAGLQVAQLQLVQRQHVLLVLFLFGDQINYNLKRFATLQGKKLFLMVKLYFF